MKQWYAYTVYATSQMWKTTLPFQERDPSDPRKISYEHAWNKMRSLPNHEHMTHAFKLAANILESNGLTMVINNILLK